MYFKPVPVGFEPCPDFRVLVVGGVVLNQDHSLPAVSPCQLLQEAEIGGAIEDLVLAVVEARLPQFDGAEDLHLFALCVPLIMRGCIAPGKGTETVMNPWLGPGTRRLPP